MWGVVDLCGVVWGVVVVLWVCGFRPPPRGGMEKKLKTKKKNFFFFTTTLTIK